MKRIVAISRPAFAAGILFLLAGVVALSTATRRPHLRACSGSWHTYKAGHFTETEQNESHGAQAAESVEGVVAEPEASPLSYVPCEETLPIALALTVHRHHFRSPPPAY
jgi:hypothetical protein